MHSSFLNQTQIKLACNYVRIIARFVVHLLWIKCMCYSESQLRFIESCLLFKSSVWTWSVLRSSCVMFPLGAHVLWSSSSHWHLPLNMAVLVLLAQGFQDDLQHVLLHCIPVLNRTYGCDKNLLILSLAVKNDQFSQIPAQLTLLPWTQGTLVRMSPEGFIGVLVSLSS